MQSLKNPAGGVTTGCSSWLARAAASILLFELVSGLAITFGPFHAATEWGLLAHTAAGILTLAPLAWYSVRHWKDYAGQALSDVLLLGYVGLGALAVCVVSGGAVTWQGLLGERSAPWMRYTHLASTFLFMAASVAHIFIAWLRRRAEFSRAAAGWLRVTASVSLAGFCAVAALTAVYSGTKYRNQFPSDYSFL